MQLTLVFGLDVNRRILMLRTQLEASCATRDVFQHKLRSIEAYRSQLQIASLVDSIRQDGPYEYLRDVHFRLYSSKKYRPLFAD